MSIRMIALKNTTGPDGRLTKGVPFNAKDETRAKFLEDGGYAKPEAEAPVVAVARPAAAPATPAK